MTNRLHSLTVVLDHDIREDDAEPILNAIRMIRGVIDVSGNVASSASYMAEQRAIEQLRGKVLDALYGKDPQ